MSKNAFQLFSKGYFKEETVKSGGFLSYNFVKDLPSYKIPPKSENKIKLDEVNNNIRERYFNKLDSEKYNEKQENTESNNDIEEKKYDINPETLEEYKNPYLRAIKEKKKELDKLKGSFDFPSSYIAKMPKSNFQFNNLVNKEVNLNMQEEKRTIKSKDEVVENYNKKASSVREYYFQNFANYSYQKTNEDYVKCIDIFSFKKEDGLFMIFDGYEGFDIADYSINRFPEIFSTYMTLFERDKLKSGESTFNKYLDSKTKNLSKVNFSKTTSQSITNPDNNNIFSNKEFEFGDIPNILIKSFKKLDFETQLSKNEFAGATGVVAFFTIEKYQALNPERFAFVKNKVKEEDDDVSSSDESKKKKNIFGSKKSNQDNEKNGVIDEKYINKDVPKYITQSQRIIYIANLGNCKAVIVNAFSATKLTEDHTLNSSTETNRVRNSGGLIVNNRIGGKIYVTRALGDHSVKRFGLISSPHVQKHVLAGGEKWLILGSSGLWEVIKEEDISRIGIAMNTSEEFGKAIIKLAKDRGAKENLSIIVIGIHSDFIF